MIKLEIYKGQKIELTFFLLKSQMTPLLPIGRLGCYAKFSAIVLGEVFYRKGVPRIGPSSFTWVSVLSVYKS
jgi:hypothetical protein